MEKVACNLCGADRPRLLFVGRDRSFPTEERFHVVRCDACGLVYLSPRPRPEELGKYYPEEYGPFSLEESRAVRLFRRIRSARHLRKLRRLIPPDGRVLEIGCATGEELAFLRDEGGWEVAGVEMSPYAAELARRRGIEVVTGNLEDGAFANQTFDFVFMKYVLEHLPDPIATLREIARLLVPGGHLWIWTNNAESLESRLFGKYWRSYDVPRHLVIFSPTTLGRALALAGFSVSSLKFSGMPNDWVGSVGQLLANRAPSLQRFFSVHNLPLLLLATPFSQAAATLRRGGRMNVLARR